MRDRPEMVFTAPNDVVSVLASPFHPHLFVGGTFGGQVLLWDARQRGLPVQRTPWAFSSGGTHAAPVYALRIAGSAHAHHLWSASTDGLVCTWSLDMLARPQETIPLTNPMHPRSARMHVTSIDAASHDPSRFFVATDEGNVFDAQRVDRAGLQAGLAVLLDRGLAGHLDDQVGSPGQQVVQRGKRRDPSGPWIRAGGGRRVGKRGEGEGRTEICEQAGGHVRGDGAEADECDAVRHREYCPSQSVSTAV